MFLPIYACLLTIVLVLSSGCSSGGGKGEGPDQQQINSEYWVSLSTSEVSLDVDYDTAAGSSTATVTIDFSGEDLYVGYAPGSTQDPRLIPAYSGQLVDGSGKAVLTLSYGGRFDQPGTFVRTLRIATLNAAGIPSAFKDLTVKLHQLDGIVAEATSMPIDAISGIVSIDTLEMNWRASTATPWIILQQTSGAGPATVDFTYDYSKAPPGPSVGVITVSGVGDAQNISRQVPVSINNDIQVFLDNSGNIRGSWGDVVSAGRLRITTHVQNWQLISDYKGVRFNPASGSGNAIVDVTVDTFELPVGRYPINVSAGVGGVTAMTGFNMIVDPPVFASLPQDLSASIWLTKDISGPGPAANINFALVNGRTPTWRVNDLPDWLTAAKLQGATSEILSVSPNNSPLADGLNQNIFTVTIDIPEKPLTVKIVANIEVDNFWLEPVRSSFSFSDYGASLPKHGVVEFREIDQFAEADRQNSLITSSSESWLVVDQARLNGVAFRLETETLDDGYHQAELTVSHPENNMIKPAIVYVGYYKSEHPAAAIIRSEDLTTFRSKQSPLGPWSYLASRAAPEIFIYNNVTGQIEDIIHFPDSSGISDPQISDDGNYLATYSPGQFRLHIYNLFTRQHEASVENSPSQTEFGFFRLNGIQFLHNQHWYEMRTRRRVDVEVVEPVGGVNHFLIRLGKGALTGSGNCGVNYWPMSLSKGKSHIKIGAPSLVLPNFSCVPPALSADKKWVAYFDATRRIISKSKLSPDDAIELQASSFLDEGLDVIGLAVTDSGLIIVATASLTQLSSIRVYDEAMTTYRELTLEGARQIVPSAGIHLTSDNKFITYIETDTGYEKAQVVTIDISKIE